MALHLFPRHLLGFRFPFRKERRRLEGIVRDWRAGDGAASLLTAFSSRFDLRIKEPREENLCSKSPPSSPSSFRLHSHMLPDHLASFMTFPSFCVSDPLAIRLS
ncbi:unnamed protein product [Sphagnum balticum]